MVTLLIDCPIDFMKEILFALNFKHYEFKHFK